MRLFLRTLTFLAGLCLVLVASFFWAKPHYQTRGDLLSERVLSGSTPVRTVVLGNSHAGAVLARSVPEPALNLSVGGQDLFEIVYKGRQLLRRPSSVRRLIIAISPFSFWYNNRVDLSLEGSPHADLRRRTYAGFPAWSFYSGDAPVWLAGRLFPLVTSDHWRRVLASPEVAPEQGRGGFGIALSDNADKGAFLDQHATMRCKALVSLTARMVESSPETHTETLEILREFVRLAAARRVEVVLFTPPYYRAFCRCVPSSWSEGLREGMSQIIAGTQTTYLDFSEDPEFVDRAEFFADSDHMNLEGKRVFTERLLLHIRE